MTLSRMFAGTSATMSVSMKPGATQFTVMPFLAISSPRLLENPNSPDFDAA